MAESLPLHRDEEREAWRDMSIASDSRPSSPRSRYRVLKYRLRISRSGFFILGGAVFCLWLLHLTFTNEPPHFPPFFHEPNLDPFHAHDQPLPAPPRPPPPSDSFETKPKIEWSSRAEAVKDAFKHAYRGYEKWASPHDELTPLSVGWVDNFNGWGVTMVDSLDTMYIMGLHDEFERGVKMVENISFTANNRTFVPFFETTIRYLGGLLSAYGLSHDLALLQKADELGMAMLPIFNTVSGFPMFSVNPATGESMGGWGGYDTGWLAEIGSCQMEYKYLAKLTGRKEYYNVAETINKRFYEANLTRFDNGLLPTKWNLTSGQPANQHISIGAAADSAYEYFLKQWILTGKSEQQSLDLYLRVTQGIIEHNLFLSPKRSLLYVTDTDYGTPTRKFEHLACFLPGLLALGANQVPMEALSSDDRQHHIWAAHGLGVSCGTMYTDTITGLGPDEVVFLSEWDLDYARQQKEQKEQMEEKAKEVEEKAANVNADEGAAATNAKDPNRPYFPDPAKGAHRKKPKPTSAKVNQTLADESRRWWNVLTAWKDGKYGPEGYVDLADKTWGADSAKERREKDRVIGAVPGLVDPPPEAPEGSELRDYRQQNQGYYLRPETIESFFVLWRTTGDERWRERGWDAFEAMQRFCRSEYGFTALKNVGYPDGKPIDSMPSYFLAETLKYLYLLFSDESLLPLDEFVLNTEAHPFPIFSWTEWEKKKFGIS